MNPKNILLVEDNPADLKMTLYALSCVEIANHIQIARDGVEALEYLFCEGAFAGRNAAEQPKLIMLDLKLPRVDGLEVLARVKGDPRTKHIPVVMLTSSREQSDLLKSYHLGVNSYIVKPVEFEAFKDAIQDLGLYWLLQNLTPAQDYT